jgi:raffinose/stachyose/melibiose transport system permease protein
VATGTGLPVQVAPATAVAGVEDALGLAGRRDDAPPGEPRRLAYLYLLPALALYVAFVVVPLLHTGWISLFDWDGVTAGTWVGLDNYRELASDPEMRGAFVHALILVAFYSLLPVALGLLLTALLSRMRVRGLAGFRAVLFLPQIIPMVVVAVIWEWMYTERGPVNQVLGAIGLGGLRRAWLGDFDAALPAVGLVATWVMYGLCMVLFLAGVQKIPTSLYDAARMDGAGPVREFVHVTLPGLRHEIVVALVLTIIAALRNFDLVFVTTGGGPGTQTQVPGLQVYNRAFKIGDVGAASSIGIALTLVIFAATFLITRLGERRPA